MNENKYYTSTHITVKIQVSVISNVALNKQINIFEVIKKIWLLLVHSEAEQNLVRLNAPMKRTILILFPAINDKEYFWSIDLIENFSFFGIIQQKPII